MTSGAVARHRGGGSGVRGGAGGSARPRSGRDTSTTKGVFDHLHHNGRDLSQRPLRARRQGPLVAGSDLVLPVRPLAPNALEAWAQVSERGYEGYAAKDEPSPCVGPGRGRGSR